MPPSGPRRYERAIVVFGRWFEADGRPTPGAERRLEKALEVARAQPDALIVLSGGAVLNDVAEGPAMRDWLVARGVSAERIQVEPAARVTLENAENVTPMLAQAGVKKLTLVTERFHMRRSHDLMRRALKHAGLDIELEKAQAPDELHGPERLKMGLRELRSESLETVNQVLLHRGHDYFVYAPQMKSPEERELNPGPSFVWRNLFHKRED